MSNTLRMYQTYSVFVGRLPSNIQKYELRDLFQGCGEIVDVVIVDGRDTNNYGFVRYKEKESALRAISELNNWSINGRTIIVAIEKNTALKIEKEEAGHPVTVTDGCGPRKRNLPKPVVGKNLGTDHITDTMYWTRLQESCTAANLKQSNTKHLSMNHLSDDINRVKGERATLWSSTYDASISFTEISRKIMQRCRQKADGGQALGTKNSAEFMCALRTIMKEINEVLDAKSVNSVEYMRDEDMEEIEQLALEGDLVREVNEELKAENDDGRNAVVNIEDKNLKKLDKKYTPKRLSDVSVQTVNEIEHEVKVNRKCLDRSMNCSDTDSDATEHVTGHVTNDQMAEVHNNHPSSGGHCGSGNKLSYMYLDPAVIDYHMSTFKKMEAPKDKSSDTVLTEVDTKSRTYENDDILGLLNSKMTLERCTPEPDFVRSNSRDSSLSDGSNDGNIDDSGVESDCFGVSKGRRSLGIVENMLGVNRGHNEDKTRLVDMPGVGHRKRFLKGSASEPSLGKIDCDPYAMKNVGRGRGVLATELGAKTITDRETLQNTLHTHSSSAEGTCGRGRGMFGALSSMKMPIGRGHIV